MVPFTAQLHSTHTRPCETSQVLAMAGDRGYRCVFPRLEVHDVSYGEVVPSRQAAGEVVGEQLQPDDVGERPVGAPGGGY